MINERFFDSREAMIEAVFNDTEAALEQALNNAGEATFMVSGGSSPAPIYKRLSEADLDWKNVYIGLVDERWVDIEHDKSNEAFISETLLKNNAADAHLVGMKNAAASAAEGLSECEQAYQHLAQPFDVTILGMGPDGHTASLFPHASGLTGSLETNDLCAVINANESAVTGSFTQRMTLSLQGILQTRHLMLLISGEEKLSTYRNALAGTDVAEMPVRAVLQQEQVTVSVYWAP